MVESHRSSLLISSIFSAKYKARSLMKVRMGEKDLNMRWETRNNCEWSSRKVEKERIREKKKCDYLDEWKDQLCGPEPQVRILSKFVHFFSSHALLWRVGFNHSLTKQKWQNERGPTELRVYARRWSYNHDWPWNLSWVRKRQERGHGQWKGSGMNGL